MIIRPMMPAILYIFTNVWWKSTILYKYIKNTILNIKCADLSWMVENVTQNENGTKRSVIEKSDRSFSNCV